MLKTLRQFQTGCTRTWSVDPAAWFCPGFDRFVGPLREEGAGRPGAGGTRI